MKNKVFFIRFIVAFLLSFILQNAYSYPGPYNCGSLYVYAPKNWSIDSYKIKDGYATGFSRGHNGILLTQISTGIKVILKMSSPDGQQNIETTVHQTYCLKKSGEISVDINKTHPLDLNVEYISNEGSYGFSRAGYINFCIDKECNNKSPY